MWRDTSTGIYVAGMIAVLYRLLSDVFDKHARGRRPRLGLQAWPAAVWSSGLHDLLAWGSAAWDAVCTTEGTR